MDDGYAAATPSRKRPQRGMSGSFGRGFGGGYDYDDHRDRPTHEPHFLDEASRNASHSSFYTAPSSSTTLLAQGSFESSWDRQSAAAALNDVASASADGPPARKRRRGVAGTILDGALNGLMYGGAAAMTAYSLWSSWKKDPPGGGEGDARRRKQQEEQEEEEALAREWGPARGGNAHQPPPAYDEVVLPGGYPSSAAAAHAAAQQTPKSNASGSPFVSKPRSRRNVYLSSSRHRRRPLFESAKASSSRSLATQQQPDEDGDEGMGEGEEDDEDEQYSRFSKQMADLIAQGEAALRSKPDVDVDVADVADEYSSAITASPSTTSNLALPTTPSRIPTYAGRAMTSSRSTTTTAMSSPAAAASWRGVGETNLRFGATGSTSRNNSPTPTSTPRRKSNMAMGGRTSSPVPALPSSPSSSSTPFVFGGNGGSSSPFRKAAGLSRSRQPRDGSEGERPVRRAW